MDHRIQIGHLKHSAANIQSLMNHLSILIQLNFGQNFQKSFSNKKSFSVPIQLSPRPIFPTSMAVGTKASRRVESLLQNFSSHLSMHFLLVCLFSLCRRSIYYVGLFCLSVYFVSIFGMSVYSVGILWLSIISIFSMY